MSPAVVASGADPSGAPRGGGKLIIVGTPIGNMGDLSERARQAFAAVDLIACEDTRRTGLLLSNCGIANPGMVVANEHTEHDRIGRVLEVLAAGGSVAIASDAGMPTISDPGAALVRAAAQAGFEVVAVPGPTAASSAIALSGFAATRWVFEGFIPRKGSERAARLVELADERRVVVFYEAPHRLLRTLADLAEVFGVDRECSVARELTKMHEAVWRGSLGRAVDEVGEPRGEYVIVIDQAPPLAPVTDDELRAAVHAAIHAGTSTKDASAEVAARFGVGRRRVYQLATEG